MQAVTMPYGKTSSRIVETKFVPKKYEMQVVTIPAGACSAASWKQSLFPKKYEMQAVTIPAGTSSAASWNKNLQVRSIAACESGRGKSAQHRAPHELTARCP